MTGCRYLFISSNGDKIIKISQPKNHKYKSVPQLANQNVLEVILFYKNKDRKPHQLLTVEFDRFRLDSNGNYEETEVDRKRAFHNFFAFGMPSLLEEVEVDDKPLPIPVAPIVPTDSEKRSLYSYINEKLPNLAAAAPYVVESKIKASREKYEEFKTIAKKSKNRLK
ncbi:MULTISPECIES: hypothetical protein [Paenibacillus]|jgi:hypothetical protein|uniref:hypothetical protein n=1 Tax=Paenibacillus TaxID=44249 RepID=UPI0001AFCDA2|nr:MULTISPECIES: hypothetical protein [Paenibacillus]EES73360.1 hypothetical protein POTG_02112 [Paenibacillus sp. oral taxon 786 str. D14]MCT2197595.1 hypothetical protein [Paenibacillus sp. p3-SID1389]